MKYNSINLDSFGFISSSIKSEFFKQRIFTKTVRVFLVLFFCNEVKYVFLGKVHTLLGVRSLRTILNSYILLFSLFT